MKLHWMNSRALWGGLLVLAGILFLLQNLGVIQFAGIIWAVLLALGGIFFLSFFIADRNFWWAIIPAGALFTLAAVVVVAALGYDVESGGVLFLGLGLTFGVLTLLPTPGGRLTWAWIPALALLVMGVLVIGAAANLINYLWPAALILVGIFLVYRTLLTRRAQ